jgi:glycosyltransferase involved in cell wall biosynthesis
VRKKLFFKFYATTVPYPYDLNGNSENIYNIIRLLSLEENVEIEFIILSDIPVVIPGKFTELLDKAYVLKCSALKTTFDDSLAKIFVCDYRAGRIFASRGIKGDYLYVADSRPLYYSKHKDIKSRLLYLRALWLERKIFKYFNRIVFVSMIDFSFSKLRCREKGVVIPIGYDLTRLKGHNNVPAIDFIFTGNLNYLPNAEAALFLITDIWRNSCMKDAELYLVGRNPGTELLYEAKNDPSLIVTGEVESIESYLNRARIYLAPLFTGSGMKNKIVQAMSAGLPIIAFPEAVTGFSNLPHGVIVVNSAEEFILRTEELHCQSDEYLKILGVSNREYVVKNLTWEIIFQNYYKPLFRIVQA